MTTVIRRCRSEMITPDFSGILVNFTKNLEHHKQTTLIARCHKSTRAVTFPNIFGMVMFHVLKIRVHGNIEICNEH